MQKSLDQKLRSLLMILTVAVLAVLFGLADTAEVKANDYPRICIGTRWVGQNEPSASAQDGSWTFSYDADSKTGTLTLNNATIYEKHTQASACIYSRTCETLIIIVNGVNNVGNTGFLVFDQYSDNSNLIIKGSGTLNAVGGYGFHSKGNIEISESTVTATATANNACGIYAGGNITISGGTVTSTATANNAYGIYAGGNITISGGTVTSTAAASDNGKAIYTENGNIKITSGTVTATANGTGDAMYVASNLEISGGTVTAKSVGAYGIRTTGNMIVEGGSVKAEGVKGIYTQGNMIVEEGSVEAEGSDFYGIAVDRSLSISGADTVFKAKGNTCAVTTGGISIDEADGLKIAKPDGGIVDKKDGEEYYYIYNGNTIATDVEIRKLFTITVTNDGHGTGTASPANALGGTTINLSATPDKGYEFDKWTSESGVTFAAPNSANTTFRMLDKDVTVKANFKPETPTGKCIITFDKNGGSGTMNPQQVNKGVATKLRKNTFTRDGYEFKNWNTKSDGSGTSYDDEDNITTNTDMTLYAQWKKAEPGPTPTPTPTVTPTPTPTGTPIPRPRPRPKDDDEEKTVEPSKPAVVNPDTVEGYFAVNGQLLSGVTMGKTKQGVAAQAVFNANRPVGWQEAFTFNMAINGKVDYTLKNGVLTIIIPKEFQKAGRTFAIMALDKNGKAWTFADTDTNPATVTATINVEGYAFALIYKD